MVQVILLNKPYNVLCQFTDKEGRRTLSDFIKTSDIYPAGRLDRDSEGLVVLTGDGRLQNKIANPRFKLWKTYWVQVEGMITEDAAEKLRTGIKLKDGVTQPAKVCLMQEPEILWNRDPPIRFRANIPTSWVEISIHEGKNRQIRRMTAAVDFPTLRLIRYSIGPMTILGIESGKSKMVSLVL